jgi:antirestriction protein ArdC
LDTIRHIVVSIRHARYGGGLNREDHKMRRDLYQDVTDKIVAAMQSGTMPWQRDWSIAGSAVPMNAISERPYSGINVLLFWMSADKGYARPRYLTFKQAKEAGGTVRAGEHGTKIYFYKQLVIRDKAAAPGEISSADRTIPMLREYTVFNVSQCDGLPDRVANGETAAPRNQDEREAMADDFIKSTGADFREGVGAPYYVPSKDFISIPAFASFNSRPAFYATAFHELTHWTGAKSRLDRDLSTRFGEHGYALEELVAEIGAAFLCAEFGFDVVSRSAAYLEGWLKAIKDNPRAIFTAASKASKAAEYLRGLAIADQPQSVAA